MAVSALAGAFASASQRASPLPYGGLPLLAGIAASVAAGLRQSKSSAP